MNNTLQDIISKIDGVQLHLFHAKVKELFISSKLDDFSGQDLD